MSSVRSVTTASNHPVISHAASVIIFFQGSKALSYCDNFLYKFINPQHMTYPSCPMPPSTHDLPIMSHAKQIYDIICERWCWQWPCRWAWRCIADSRDPEAAEWRDAQVLLSLWRVPCGMQSLYKTHVDCPHCAHLHREPRVAEPPPQNHLQTAHSRPHTDWTTSTKPPAQHTQQTTHRLKHIHETTCRPHTADHTQIEPRPQNHLQTTHNRPHTDWTMSTKLLADNTQTEPHPQNYLQTTHMLNVRNSNRMVIGTYTHPTLECHVKWSRVN